MAALATLAAPPGDDHAATAATDLEAVDAIGRLYVEHLDAEDVSAGGAVWFVEMVTSAARLLASAPERPPPEWWSAQIAETRRTLEIEDGGTIDLVPLPTGDPEMDERIARAASAGPLPVSPARLFALRYRGQCRAYFAALIGDVAELHAELRELDGITRWTGGTATDHGPLLALAADVFAASEIAPALAWGALERVTLPGVFAELHGHFPTLSGTGAHEASDALRSALASAIREHAATLAEATGWRAAAEDFKRRQGEVKRRRAMEHGGGRRGRPRLPPRSTLGEMAAELAEAREAFYGWALRPDDTGTMLATDAAFAAHLRTLGASGAKLASSVGTSSAGRWRALEAGGNRNEALALWIDPTAQPWGVRWLGTLGVALWNDVVLPAHEREAKAKPHRTATVAGYAAIPKAIAGTSWAIGSEGVTGVEIDGDRYGYEPRVAVHVANRTAALPKTYALLGPEHASRPHQTVLALGHGEREPEVFPLAAADSAGAGLISTLAAKAQILLLADPKVRAGGLATKTVGEFRRELFPNATRRRARDDTATIDAFHELGSLWLVNPFDGNMVRLWDVAPAVRRLADGTPDPEAEIWAGLSKTFEQALIRHAGAFAGEFLVNISGAMGIPNNRPLWLRLYLRAAAEWNAAFVPGSGAYNPRTHPFRPLEAHAAGVNAYSPAVAEYLAATAAGRRKLATARKELPKQQRAVRDAWDALMDRGLIGAVEQKGRGRGVQYRPAPPEAYLEAWRQARRRGARPNEG